MFISLEKNAGQNHNIKIGRVKGLPITGHEGPKGE
jgi:hypothetical protein